VGGAERHLGGGWHHQRGHGQHFTAVVLQWCSGGSGGGGAAAAVAVRNLHVLRLDAARFDA